MLKHIDAEGLRFPGMSQAVSAGPWITVAGQIATRDGQLVGVGDPRAQVEQCFENIGNVLKAADAEIAEIVSLTCYLTNANVFPAYSDFKKKLFPNHGPAGTTVIVAGLLFPGALIEIQATAYCPTP